MGHLRRVAWFQKNLELPFGMVASFRLLVEDVQNQDHGHLLAWLPIGFLLLLLA